MPQLLPLDLHRPSRPRKPFQYQTRTLLLLMIGVGPCVLIVKTLPGEAWLVLTTLILIVGSVMVAAWMISCLPTPVLAISCWATIALTAALFVAAALAEDAGLFSLGIGTLWVTTTFGLGSVLSAGRPTV